MYLTPEVNPGNNSISKNAYRIFIGISFLLVVLVLLITALVSTILKSKAFSGVACTEEAMLCPNGSAVGRAGPKCEFAPCPTLAPGEEPVDYYNSQTHTNSGNLSNFNDDTNQTPIPTIIIRDGCVVGGCSGELCVNPKTTNDEDVIGNNSPDLTVCDYKPDYACFIHSVCEKQKSGSCGWSETTEYTSCLQNLEAIKRE